MWCTSLNPNIRNCDIEKSETAKLVGKKFAALTGIKRKLPIANIGWFQERTKNPYTMSNPNLITNISYILPGIWILNLS